MSAYRMMKLRKNIRYAVFAGMAGAFLIPQISFAAPTDGSVAQGGARINQSGVNTNITSTTANNVLTWTDYSVNSGETVQYDNGLQTNNYLNIVTGSNTSKIYGTITGGKDVYLVNPNGVIFGKGATVNVGNLHVSTQDTSTITDAAKTAFMANGASPLNTTAAGKADVVNMGTINATSVEVVGKSIRFLNDANVTVTNSPVILRTDAVNGGTAHIGYKSGHSITAGKYTVNGSATTDADHFYQLVGTTTEFQNINNDLTKNYMLEDNIDFAHGALTPIGGNTRAAFSGKLDGNFFQVKNFSVSGFDDAGLFGKLSGARVENIGVSGATITGKKISGVENAGGIAASSTGNTTLKNVYTQDTTITGNDGRHGGLIGNTDHTVIEGSYSTAQVEEGGGIIGRSSTGTTVTDSYSAAKRSSGFTGADFIYYITPHNGTTIKNSYAVGTRFTYSSSLGPNQFTNTFLIDPSDKTTSRTIGTYTGWDINNNGDPGAKWRIYEGRTTPLLTAFMDGTATATYSYRYFNNNGTAPDKIDGVNNTVKSNNGKDLTGLTYNSKYLRIVDADAPNTPGDKSKIQYEPSVNLNKVEEYAYTGTAADKTNGIRNAGTKAILWSDQHGPNLRGVNVTVGKRKVSLDSNNMGVLRRVYNGKTDVKSTFEAALKGGSKSGITADDLADNSVGLDTMHLTARMADKHVGTAKEVTFGGTITFDNTKADSSNYEFDNSSISNIKGKITITPAPLYLTIHKKTAADKIYDGTDEVKDADMLQSKPNIELNKTIATGTKGEIMTNDGGTQDTVDLAATTDPTYTDASGNKQIHADAHKLRYKNVGLRTDGAYANDAGNYELFYQDAQEAEKKVTGGDVYLDGKITRRQITKDSFKVYKKSDNSAADASKVYDGNNTYTFDKNSLYLSTNAGATGDRGIVSRDQGHITFDLTGDGKGYFKKADGTTDSKDVKTAKKIAYDVIGKADSHVDNDGIGHLLSDYYITNPDNANELATGFNATGEGKITPKTLTATKKNDPITKVYDALAAHTDGNRNEIKGDALVTLSGVVSGDSITNTTTATYASKDVAYAGGVPTTQNVTYNVAFTTPNAEEADNYTFDTAPNTTTVTRTTTLTGLGKITPRPVTLTFGPATKIYDGTDTNTQKTLSAMSDRTTGNAVLGADGYSTGNVNLTGVTSRFGDGTDASFTANVNAGGRTVEYTGVGNSLGGNYSVANTQYGTGTITRRRIDKSGFRVYNADNTVADATKVYDGNNRHTLAPGAYLTGTAASGDTGIVTRDYGKVTFALKTGSTGHFSSDADGNNRTSHVSEAQYVAYDVVARSSDLTNHPLSNYTFGSAAEESAGTLRKLETVTDAKPSHVTAQGTITPRAIRATTYPVEKVYDGMAEHTDGNRNIQRGRDIVSLATMITDETDGQPTNTSTARYADQNVSRDGSGNIINKDVTYTAQLTGKYADDYQIVDAGNNVISSVSGSGTSKTVTANLGLQVNKGTITPRKLNIKMGDVSKTYDGTSTNTNSSVTKITDAPQTAVIGTILTGDSITTGALKTAWDNKRSGGTASSSYGNGTGSAFRHNANASNGTPHDVRYTKMDEAFKDAFGTTAAGNYTVDKTVYGKGTINRKPIDPNNFDIVDAHGNASHATKVYDGTSNYAVPFSWNLRPSTGPGTGVITADEDKISFAIDPNKGAHFTKADNTTRTANVYEAQRVAYNVKATADNGYEYLLKNYTLNGKNLESGEGTATGAGEIKRRTINVGLAEPSGIDKVYDGNANLIDTATRHHQVFSDDDGRANVGYATGTTNANKLVRKKNGYTVDDGAQVTVQGSYTDKDVARNGGNVTTKSITYNVKIAGDAGKNYYLTDGSTTVNAENGMNLSATGKITPRDLSGAFKKVTKVYDGTKNVDPSKVGFEIGANGVVSGDAVGLASVHTQEFESENVRGSGTTWIAPDGTRQHNWINYSNLSLGGAQAGNYTIASTAKGLGEITPYVLNPSTVNFNIGPASKTYDGTKAVKNNESAAAADVKNYITAATVIVNGTPVSVRDGMTISSAAYDTTANVNNGTSQGVTYKLTYNTSGGNGNFTIAGGTTLTATGTGVITPKTVNATINGPLTKTYDAQTTVNGAAKNGAGKVVAGADDLVTLEGLVGSDKNTTTAVYADKNAGNNKTVNYTIATDTADASNYTIKVNGAAVMTPYATTNNTIEKRRVDVTFGDVSKLYDTTTKNNKPVVGTVSAEDAAVLNIDRAGIADGTHKLTNLAGLDSDYGTVKTDGSFAADPNVGTKSVQYAGLRAAMNDTLGAGVSDNYDFDVNGYGKGTIARRTIDASKFKFKTNAFAEKEYDGTRDVKWKGNKDEIKNYFASSKVEIDGKERDINLADINVSTKDSKYRTKDVGAYQTTADGKKYNAIVDYSISFTSNNFDITGLTAGGYIPYEDKGIITPKDVNVTVKSSLTKTYDATEKVTAGMVKNAAGEMVNNLNDNLTLDGLVAGDGTTYTTKAQYENKNAGTNKPVTYDVKLDAPHAGNYTLKFNNAKVSVSNPVRNGENEITKRTVHVTFGDVSKLYDTTTKNNRPVVGTVSAEDAAVLNIDRAGIADGTHKLTNLAGLDSDYGTVKTDGSFAADPNVGTKSVQYAGLRAAMNDTLGAGVSDNYDFDVNGYGKGTIARRTIDASKFKFKTNAFAEKEYDGTRDVKWKGNKDEIKNYFASSKVEIDGKERDINLADINVSTKDSKYRTKDVGAYQTTADGKKYNAIVDYHISFTSNNFDITGLTAGGYIPYEDKGIITPKDITPYFTKDHIIKEYDGTSHLSDLNKEAIEKTKRLSILVPGDKVTLDVVGHYMHSTMPQEEKNASADTEKDAREREGLRVKYDLKLGGAQKNNYTIGAQGDTGTVYGTGDIYKKTLEVDVARKEKDYDGTVVVNNLAAGDITFSGLVGSETLSLDSGALNKVQGQYLDSNGNADADVSRDVHRNVLDKAVKYTGFDNALSDLATRNNTAKNYRVADGGKSYTVNDAKGRINPLSINPNHPTDGVTTTFDAAGATKIYDRTRAVKHNGQSTSEALKNYLTDATVMVGGKARSIRNEIEIDPTKTHYDDKNAGTGKTVTYGFKYQGNNFEIADFTRKSDVKGEIRQKDVKVLPVDQLWKTYDSERDVYVEGDDSIFTRRGGKQGNRVTTGDSVLELEPNGIISGDVVQNDSWAEFTDENAGTGKKVKYHTSFSGTDAANYRFVDVSGREIAKPLETNNNTIAKRKLNIGFDGLPYVTKAYDTDAKNDKVTARITDDPNGSARKVLQRDNVHVFGDCLTQLNDTNIQSDYGEGKTDQTFRSDPNAGRKDVQYRGVGKELRKILGDYADNYEPVPENAYSDGEITKADVSRNEFDPNFTHAHKEYDGTSDVQNLDKRYDEARSFWNAHKLDQSNIESLTGSYRGTSSKRGKDVGTNKIVDYTLKLSNRNFNFVGWDGVIQKEGTGDITPRELTAEHLPKQTKIYDGTKNIASVGDDLVTFRHKSGERPFIKNDDVRNSSTATYDTENVAWKDGVWNQGNGTAADVGVTYALGLSGADAANYKIVDSKGDEVTNPKGLGKITPKDIHLKADPQTRWINEGLPKSYTGKPMGSNLGHNDIPELLPNEVLPGSIDYSSPNARLRWGDYMIRGDYHALNGTDGDAVSRNYRFVQNPANATALHIGPYVPNTDYYQALTQTSKMLPDEYAYENASLDRRSHFGRDPEAEISYEPPSLNMVKDGVDISKNGIEITDETVFRLVNEVFGA